MPCVTYAAPRRPLACAHHSVHICIYQTTALCGAWSPTETNCSSSCCANSNQLHQRQSECFLRRHAGALRQHAGIVLVKAAHQGSPPGHPPAGPRAAPPAAADLETEVLWPPDRDPCLQAARPTGACNRTYVSGCAYLDQQFEFWQLLLAVTSCSVCPCCTKGQ
jgi:hypothetical protein